MSTAPATARPLPADYFDGQHARPRRVQAHIKAQQLILNDSGVELLSVPVRLVSWPERTRHGARIAQLPDGGALHGLDAAAWDIWAGEAALHEGWTVRLQQSWRWTLAAVVALVLTGVWAYRWGLTVAATGILAVTPLAVDQEIGQVTLQSLEGRWLKPSRLSPAEQRRVRVLFDQVVRLAPTLPPGSHHGLVTVYELRLRRSTIGPNAFALPDGSIVVTDELVELLKGHDDALLGVLAHEVGHVRHRHGMRLFVQAGMLGAAASLLWGDFSSLIAVAPTLMGQMDYSRDFEREADQDAIALLQAKGLKPSAMVTLFTQLDAHRRASARKGASPSGADTSSDSENQGNSDIGIAFSSHPPDAERIQRFRQADLATPGTR